MGRGRWQACPHGGADISKQCLSLIVTGCPSSSALTISLWMTSKETRRRAQGRRRATRALDGQHRANNDTRALW